MLLFRAIECQVGDIRLIFKLGDQSRSRQRIFTGHARGFTLSTKVCEGKDQVSQREILGGCPRNPDYDAEVMVFSAAMRELLIDRRDSAAKSPLVRVIYIGPVELNGFVTQWSFATSSAPRFVQGDPNASLLVASLGITSPQLSERMDVLAEVIDDLRLSTERVHQPTPARQTIGFVPRLKIDICVNDVIACLIPVDERTEPTSSLILSSTQCVMSLSSNYIFFPLEKPNLPSVEGQAYIPVEKVFTFNSILGPAFVTCLPKPFSLDTTNRVSRYADSSAGFGDPLLSISALELKLDGRILGCLYDEEQSVVLDLSSTILDTTCVTDAVSMELWQPAAISSLKHLIGFVQRVSSVNGTTSSRDERPGPKSRIPVSIYVHVAISQLGIIVTGKDLNPAEDGSLSRGVALRSGLAVQFCSLPSHGNSLRMKRQHAQAHARQRLWLPDELITDVIGFSDVEKRDADSTSFFKINIWDTALRSAIATEFAADHSYEVAEEVEELKSSEFFWISRIEIDATLSIFNSPHPSKSKRLQMNIKIPYTHTKLQLAETYCLLLASNTLRQFLLPSSQQNFERKDADFDISFRVSVDTCQALLKFPLQEQLSLRFNGLKVQKVHGDSMKVDFTSLLIWVPLPARDNRWEEIIRLKSWRTTISFSPTEPLAMVFEGDSAHIRIPHTYVLADLILDLNVSFKCIKHLFSALSSEVGSIIAIPTPNAEPAKIVPVISLKIGCFSLEAADDPLESRLGLAWRAGLEAARSRIEREDAFEAKVAAIHVAEIEQGNVVGERFTPTHTVSVEEARERLMQVHSLSWSAIHREFREEQRRREDALRKHMPGGHINLSHDDIKPLVPVTPLSKFPPLLRIVFNRFSIAVTQPLFPSCDLPEFLYDFGKGLPKETEFSLLVPMHLNLSLGPTSVTLRDYPLPLLKVPPGSSDTTPAWAIDTDLVIAEEMGDSTCLIWKKCTVLDAGVSGVGTKALALSVPKTTMPVKTYANPHINVLTNDLTELCWGASYNAALQDVMRVIDSLSSPPPDPSPIIGFWDKVSLSP